MNPIISSLAVVAGVTICCLAGKAPEHAFAMNHDGPSTRLPVGVEVMAFAAMVSAGRKTMEDRAQAFSNLGRRLSATRTAREAAQIVAEAADTLCGWDACLLDLCAPGEVAVTTVFCVDTINGRRKEIIPESISPNVSPMAQRVIEKGAQLILRQEGSGFLSNSVAFGDTARPSASLIYVPVRNDARVVGILSIQSYSANAYTEEDLNNLQALADHCSGALERVWAEAALSEANEQLRLALAAGKMGTWTIDLTGKGRVTLSSEFEAILGLHAGEFPGTEEALLAFIHPQDRAALREAFTRSVQSAGDYEVEFRFQPRDRSPGWLLGRGRAYYDADNKPIRLTGVVIDITSRKEAEQIVGNLNAQLEHRVAERTRELAAINHELEAFAYSVSHDLRAPLRGIRGFSEALLERYTSSDSLGQEFLRRICDSSAQMDRLIEDLLKLSRASLSDLSRQPVDLTVMAESIVEDLREAEPKRLVNTVVGPNLWADGDERLLTVALENLLRNAWKFTRDAPDARVEFGFTTIPEPAFFVRDNGAGFDMAYADKLFGVFQRLHSHHEFPGTGVGLATVQRIVKRHGGRAWATGVVNGGATFYFTLPAQRVLNRETDAPGVDH